VFVPEKEYESKRDTLPDICFAIRCPIDKLETKEWPNLDEVAKLLDSEANFEKKCQVEDKKIEQVMYYSRYQHLEKEEEGQSEDMWAVN
jgi:hypothetical protein